MDALKKISRAAAALIPGTRANIAMRKRAYERELRAKGYTWTEVLRRTAEHFRKNR